MGLSIGTFFAGPSISDMEEMKQVVLTSKGPSLENAVDVPVRPRRLSARSSDWVVELDDDDDEEWKAPSSKRRKTTLEQQMSSSVAPWEFRLRRSSVESREEDQ